jgi:Mrp family chromosome partitioning ATPase/capsular polysaccharide biosynthesis protein
MDAPRYQSLRDYVRVIRERRLLIIAAVVLCVGAALAVSARQEKVYTAEAALSFQDENADLGDLGAAVPVSQTPEQRAAIGASSVTMIDVAREARAKLHTKITSRELLASVSARPEARTNLVIVQAQWGDPRFAADLANAFAGATRDLRMDQARARYRRRARILRDQLDATPRDPSSQLTRSLTVERIARYDSLAQFAAPVVLAARADRPTTPDSPKPVRNAVLGLLVGLTLGLVAAFGRDALDRRVRSSREVSEDLNLPLLAQVREGLMGRTPVGNSSGRITDAELEPFRILRQNLEFLDAETPPRMILVTSAVAEEGKTTVATALASAEALSGRRVLLAECDLRRPSFSARLHVERNPGLVEFFAGTAPREKAIRTVTVSPARSHEGFRLRRRREVESASAELAVLPAGGPASQPAELLGSPAMREALNALRDAYDVVIIDAPPLLPVVDALELVQVVDAVVVCVRAGSTSRDQVRGAKAALEHAAPRPTGIVVTCSREPLEEGYAYSYAGSTPQVARS